MGAGKSTIGRHLAKSLGMEFVDSDHELERRTGASIPLIFDVEGEAGFRQREKKLIDELTQRTRIVLATGGGVVLDPDNRAWLRERGRVIYLYATVEQLLTRTAKDRNRPLLQTADPRARLQELLQARDPLYREVADVVVDTGGRSARGAEREILAKIRPGARGRRQARSTQRPRRRNPLNETMVDDEDPGC
ncbi:MAG: shikimate kinase AroK [Gammaproteobacteria bacterium]